MTDPLGQSQIIPYLQGLSKYGYQFTILSFEKKSRYKKEEQIIREQLLTSNIEWKPLRFTRRPPLLSKLYDAIRMKWTAFSLQKKNNFSMLHCRSYIAADIGLIFKKKFGTKFLFDMRGFWADEKRDGGSWNVRNPIFRKIYSYYKKRESEYIQKTDHIVCLTEAAKREIVKWPFYNSAVPITVIPCCADMDLFSLVTDEQRQENRRLLKIPSEKLVISYLGSIGTWYMLDEMLEVFRLIKINYPSALFLFITHSDPSLIFKRLPAHSIERSDIKIIEAKRNEVPGICQKFKH